jgi:membrane protein DedA with SNARE-associated domain
VESIVTWIVETVGALGYPGIVLLMALESSFFPFPSEVVMIPAGYLAFDGRMSVPLVIICGIVGSLIGSYFNYYLSLWLGRPIVVNLIERYGKYLLVSLDKYIKAENMFRRHGEITTFLCRFIPGVRQLISMPAGLSRMKIAPFSFYTGLGAGIWVAILTLMGWVAGRHHEAWKVVWDQQKHFIYFGLGSFILVVLAGYTYNELRKRKKAVLVGANGEIEKQ